MLYVQNIYKGMFFMILFSLRTLFRNAHFSMIIYQIKLDERRKKIKMYFKTSQIVIVYDPA